MLGDVPVDSETLIVTSTISNIGLLSLSKTKNMSKIVASFAKSLSQY